MAGSFTFYHSKNHAYAISRTDQQSYYSWLYGNGWLFYSKKYTSWQSAWIDIGYCKSLCGHLFFIPAYAGKRTT